MPALAVWETIQDGCLAAILTRSMGPEGPPTEAAAMLGRSQVVEAMLLRGLIRADAFVQP